MTAKVKIYIAAGAAILAAIFGYSLWTNFQIGRLEDAAEQAKAEAAAKQQRANEIENESRKYEEKIAYLGAKLSELQVLARKQDEELEIIENLSGDARRNVEHARRIRTSRITAEELCAKLAELGHGCE